MRLRSGISRLFSLLLALPFVACTSAVDVVAVPRSSGTTVIESTLCGELLMKSEVGELLRLDASATSVAIRRSGCTLPTTEPVAVRSDGTVWAVVGGKVIVADVDLTMCIALPVNLAATAMAFVVAPGGRETLYAIVDDILVAFDPESLLRTPVGALGSDVIALAGSADGRLFAVVQPMNPTLVEVAVGDGSILQEWPIPFTPTAGPLVGAATGAGRTMLLVDGTTVYTLDPFTQTFHQRNITNSTFVVAGGPPCKSPDPRAIASF